MHADGLRVLEAGPELLSICSRSHDTCIHDELLPLLCLNTALHFKCLKLHKREAGRLWPYKFATDCSIYMLH